MEPVEKGTIAFNQSNRESTGRYADKVVSCQAV